MAKPRICPNCRIVVPFGHGYRFDAHHNMVCDGCGKVIFPAEPEAEPILPPPILQPSQPPYDVPMPLETFYPPIDDD